MRALKRKINVGLSTLVPVTTQAHEGIETYMALIGMAVNRVTTQAHEGIETLRMS